MSDPGIRAAALDFVRHEAGFAQLVTIGAAGLPVGRTTSAFLNEDFSVDLVQRKGHRRVGQIERDDRILVLWSGAPAADSRNDSPWVFDLGLTIPRVVFVRGTASALEPAATWEIYSRHSERLRGRGLTKAPPRDRAEVEETLAGIRIEPARVRCEGFGEGAEAFNWKIDTEGTNT